MRYLYVISQWLVLYYALSGGIAGVAVTLANITPIFVFALSILLLHEHPTLRKSVAAILVLVLSLLI